MSDADVRLVFCTFPDLDPARRIGGQVVEERLAACINLLPGVESIYRWKDQVESAGEVLGILKTSSAALPALETRLTNLHPYEVPEVIALDPAAVFGPYARWVQASVGSICPSA